MIARKKRRTHSPRWKIPDRRIQMAISRTRKFAADETGAGASGDPQGLASALEKLGIASERRPLDPSPQTARLFIINPLSGESLLKLFSTHPPLEERIARLRAMTEEPH
jgi:heat shock protein HtpX